MQNIQFAAVGHLLCKVALQGWWPQFQARAPVNIISQDKVCTDFLQNKQPIQIAGLLHCVLRYYSCFNCYYFTVPKRNVGVLSSVKDTIRRARLKGAAEADGILAVKFIKLFS